MCLLRQISCTLHRLQSPLHYYLPPPRHGVTVLMDHERFLTCNHEWQACSPAQGGRFPPQQYHRRPEAVASRVLRQSS